MVMGGDSCSKVVGSNGPTHKNFCCLFEKTKIKEKEAREGPFERTIKNVVACVTNPSQQIC